ncbi:hypothetical protein [Tabrizicola sp. M-4]|uniref:hypothetical protein n=1 Tax=Tabrizicola sp. M-4 TaxID=3055847 RepID=UPI003DA951F5
MGKPETIGPTRRSPKATEAAIRRAISAWKAAGLTVGAVEVSPDGTIRITTPIDRAEEPQQRQAPKKWRG